jgi:hypothetical protein
MLGMHRKITELKGSHYIDRQSHARHQKSHNNTKYSAEPTAIGNVTKGIIMAISYQLLYAAPPTAQIPG